MCLHTFAVSGVCVLYLSLFVKGTPFLGALPPPPSAGLGAWSLSGPERGGCRHWALAAVFSVPLCCLVVEAWESVCSGFHFLLFLPLF